MTNYEETLLQLHKNLDTLRQREARCAGNAPIDWSIKESVRTLAPDQYFYIIFFGDGKLHELADGKMLRASPKSKARRPTPARMLVGSAQFRSPGYPTAWFALREGLSSERRWSCAFTPSFCAPRGEPRR